MGFCHFGAETFGTKFDFFRIMRLLIRPLRSIRCFFWALIVAFMVGVHNFYTQEMDSPDSIVSSIQMDGEEEDCAPKV